MEEDVAQILQGMARLAFGHLPVLEWHETWIRWADDFGTEYDDGPVHLRDFSITLDLEKLHLVSEFNLGYVKHLLKAVIARKLADPEAVFFKLQTGKKYSFSDTEDWWDDMKLDSLADPRRRFNVDVEIK